jgi:hypothetical protein
MRSLDIRSQAGQAHEVNNEKAWAVIMDYFDNLGVVRQRLHDAHPADGIIRSNDTNKPIMLVEVKSRRDFDEEFFWRKHAGMWLISNHKIEHNIPIARSLGIPFVGAMHIIESRVVLVKTIYDKGALAPGIEVRSTQTRANINGGVKIIPNAFIPMHDAIRIVYAR